MVADPPFRFDGSESRPLGDVYDDAGENGGAVFIVEREPAPDKQVVVGNHRGCVAVVRPPVILEFGEEAEVRIGIEDLVQRVFEASDRCEKGPSMSPPCDSFQFPQPRALRILHIEPELMDEIIVGPQLDSRTQLCTREKARFPARAIEVGSPDIPVAQRA